jgi:hypothetical protein
LSAPSHSQAPTIARTRAAIVIGGRPYTLSDAPLSGGISNRKGICYNKANRILIIYLRVT